MCKSDRRRVRAEGRVTAHVFSSALLCPRFHATQVLLFKRETPNGSYEELSQNLMELLRAFCGGRAS